MSILSGNGDNTMSQTLSQFVTYETVYVGGTYGSSNDYAIYAVCDGLLAINLPPYRLLVLHVRSEKSGNDICKMLNEARALPSHVMLKLIIEEAHKEKG